jgi:Fructose-1-6-bisphosphatase, N-terminal domain
MDDSESMMKKCVADVCQPGNCLQCAGYVLYSSATILVLTVGTGVFGFTLDHLVGEFVLTHDNIKIPDTGKIYSFNEGNYGLWDKPVQEYMDSLKVAEKWGGKPYSVRLSHSNLSPLRSPLVIAMDCVINACSVVLKHTARGLHSALHGAGIEKGWTLSVLSMLFVVFCGGACVRHSVLSYTFIKGQLHYVMPSSQ